jgi:hypothetical protein
MRKTRIRTLPLLFALCLGAWPLVADEEEPPSFKEALSGGDTAVNLRYRFEAVDQDDFEKDATASTLRTTLSYRTLAYRGFSLFLEAENVTDIGTDGKYNNKGAGSLGNGVTDRPVIADPEITEVNQSYLRWQGEDTRLDLGRQEINWGDQRFVGAVGWRQNHQSFDAVSLVNESLERTRFQYGFIHNTNRLFGDNKQMASHLLSATVKLPLGGLNFYGLYLDYNDEADFGLSRATYGLEWAGSHELEGGAKLLWEAEYADQSDVADNPVDVSASYQFLMLGGVIGGVTVKGAYEVQEGSDDRDRFLTPLATLHKFNGWADKFLTTPGDGLEDLYLSLSGHLGSVGWTLVGHDFSADNTGIDYGTEIDVQFSWKADWGQSFALKGAFYEADEHSVDTQKIWFISSYSF